MGTGDCAPQVDEILQSVRFEWLFEPGHFIVGQHLGCPPCRREAVFPERVAPAGIDHQQRVGAIRIPRVLHDGLIQRSAVAAERSPTDLECPETLIDQLGK